MDLRRLRIILIAAALALFLTACGGSAATGTANSPEAGDGETAAALSGEFPTVSGASIDLNSLEGQDVVLWFWAPW